MTIAIDKVSGKIIGQAVAALPPTTLKPGLDASVDALVLLTRDGYQYVSTASVRLEKLS